MMQTLEAGDGFGECADLPHMVHELFRELFQEESFRPAFHRAGDDGLKKGQGLECIRLSCGLDEMGAKVVHPGLAASREE